MNKSFYSFLCALSFALPLSVMDHSLVKVDSIQAPSDLGNIELYRNHNGFSVKQDGFFSSSTSLQR